MKLGTLVSKTPLPLGTHWWMLAVTVWLLGLVAAFVDLKPVVEENFFFSTSDPGFGQSKKIERRFPSQPELILAVSSRIFHHRDTWAGSKDSLERSKRSTR